MDEGHAASQQDEPLLKAQELGDRLRAGKSSILRMAAKGLIPSVPWGPKLSCRRFDEQAVRKALANLPKPPLRTYHPPRKGRAAVKVEPKGKVKV